jgi:hypothetical protein
MPGIARFLQRPPRDPTIAPQQEEEHVSPGVANDSNEGFLAGLGEFDHTEFGGGDDGGDFGFLGGDFGDENVSGIEFDEYSNMELEGMMMESEEPVRTNMLGQSFHVRVSLLTRVCGATE